MDAIEWTEKEVEITSLIPYEKNPRTITDAQFKRLKESIEQDGYHSRIKVTHDLLVVGGHQRLRALAELGFKRVVVLVPSRELTHQEFGRILLRDNHNNGLFDMDELANAFDLEELREIGLHDVMNIAPFDEDEKDEDLRKGTRMIKCPSCGEVFQEKGNHASKPKEDF